MAKHFSLNSIQHEQFELMKTASKTALGAVFMDRTGSYLNELNLFIAHFNTIPNAIEEININCKKANLWFAQHYEAEIKEHFYNKLYFDKSKKAEIDDAFYFLFDDLLVDFDTNRSCVRFLFKKTEISKVETVIKNVLRFRKRKQRTKPEISLLVNSRMGIHTNTFEINRPKLSIKDNYNDDFHEVHQIILSRLSRKDDKGLVLLHGKPGTGKTSYIRYLLSVVKKDVIFLPPNMASAITNPDLISVLIENPNSIFVIEDAENIIMDRESNGQSPVSALLNISDGLLADCLKIQVICSFNTDLSKVDNALLRKGRLIAKYEFKELDIQKAQSLSNKLGFKNIINKPMNLTDIYNQEEREFELRNPQNTIGFRSIIKN